MPRERLALYEFLPRPGGGQRVCALLAQTLSRRYDVDLLSPVSLTRSWWTDHFDVNLDDVRVGTTLTRGFGWRRVDALPERYDIFVNTEYAYWAIDPRGARTRLIMAHDAHPLGRRPNYLKDYQCAIACSDYGRGKLEDEGWPVDKKVIYPPIFDPRVLPAGGPGPKLNQILNVARFDRNRNNNSLPTVVEAFRSVCDLGLRDYELVLAGWVHDESLLDELADAARGYPVRFVRGPSRDALRNLYRESRFLLNIRGIDAPLPTTAFSHEALGVVTVEAISHGCLPIVHGFAGHLETVPDPRLHIEDLDSMPQRLIEIVRRFEDPYAWSDAWRRLYDMARRRFSEDAYLRNFVELVDELR